MAERLEIFTIRCPANTPQSAAVEHDVSISPGDVRRIEVVIPAGHAYLTGLAIGQAHTIIIPASGSEWLSGDDDHIPIDTDSYLNNGSWSVFVFNADPLYDHSWQLRIHVDELPDPIILPALIGADEIHAAGSLMLAR